MRFGEFANRLGEPMDVVLDAHCAKQFARLDTWDYINPGCGEADLHEAERRLGQALHPFHRIILRYSNGGSLPNIGGLTSWWAAAVPREDIWQPVGPVPSAESVPLELRSELAGEYAPEEAWIMTWETQMWDQSHIAQFASREAAFLPFVAGPQSGQRMGYVRGRSEIAVVQQGEPLAVLAPSFEAFMRNLHFCLDEDLPYIEQPLREVIAAIRG